MQVSVGSYPPPICSVCTEKGKQLFMPNSNSSLSPAPSDCLVSCLLVTEDLSQQSWESNVHCMFSFQHRRGSLSCS